MWAGVHSEGGSKASDNRVRVRSSGSERSPGHTSVRSRHEKAEGTMRVRAAWVRVRSRASKGSGMTGTM